MRNTSLLILGLFSRCVLGEVCDIGSNIYLTSDEYPYLEGCYAYISGNGNSQYRHYEYTPNSNDMIQMIIEWEENEGVNSNRALIQDERLMCTMPDYSGGIVSGDAIFEPCVDLDTFEDNGDVTMDNFEEIPGKSVSVTFTCGCELPEDLDFCNFQISGGNDNLRDTASGFYTGDIDGCYYAEYDLDRHFMTDGKFPLKYVLDRGEDPTGVTSSGDPVSPILVKAFPYEPGNTNVYYYDDGEFDLTEFSWVFDLIGEYSGWLSSSDDPIEVYEYYAMWSPEEKDNPEDIESWFAMRRDEEGEVFIEDVSSLVSFKCGCSGEVDSGTDEDDDQTEDQDGDTEGLTNGSSGGNDVISKYGKILAGIVATLALV